MKKPLLVMSRITFDTARIAGALHLSEKQVVDAFTDGRGAWPFSEYWGEALYDFLKHSNSNNPLSDGAVALEQLRNFNVSVKALTANGIKFQQSKDVGFGRSSTKEGLLHSLESCDRVIAVDVTGFPIGSFIPLDTTRLVSAVHRGELGTNGWKRARLRAWLHETYDVSTIDLTL